MVLSPQLSCAHTIANYSYVYLTRFIYTSAVMAVSFAEFL